MGGKITWINPYEQFQWTCMSNGKYSNILSERQLTIQMGDQVTWAA